MAPANERRRGIRWTVALLAVVALLCYVGLFLSRMSGHSNKNPQDGPASSIRQRPW